MSRCHTLKIWKHWYEEVRSGRMTFQVRDDTDRCFQAGDTIELRAWDTQRGDFAPGSPALYVTVVAVYRLPGLQPGYVGLSIRLRAVASLGDHVHQSTEGAQP